MGLDMEILRELNFVSIIVRVILALVIGAMLGAERGKKHSPAGFKTYMLVCLGATLVMMTNQYVFQAYHTSDPVRMGAQVISGIGFLGAGTIIVTGRQQIKGITTAAGLWVAACCGLAIGIGFYEGAVVGGIFVLVVMVALNGLDSKIKRNSKILTIYIEFGGKKSFSSFIEDLREKKIDIIDMQIINNKFTENIDISAVMNLKIPEKRKHDEVLQVLATAEGVAHVEEI